MILTNAQLKQHAATGIAVLLGIAILLTLICSIRGWYHDWTLIHQATASTESMPADDDISHLIASLPSTHIFGQNFTKNGAIPVSSLELRVTGIVKINQDTQNSVSKAYLSISGQPSKIYQPGDSLPDGVKVYDITADTVILENDGRLEKLPLPRNKLQFKPREVEDSEQ
jgi:hypothetical protein